MEKDKIILNSKNIVKESKTIVGISILFELIMMGFGLLAFVTLLSQKDFEGNKTLTLLFCSIFIIIPLISLIKKFIISQKLKTTDFVVITDTLRDKEIYEYTQMSDSTSRDCDYLLYFDNYYTKYNKTIKVNIAVYDEARKNDKFYLVFVGKKILAFNTNKYVLDDAASEKLIDIEELSNYINIKEYETKNDGEVKNLTKKRIIKDFKKDQRFTVIMQTILTIFLITLTIGFFIMFKNILALIVMLLFTIFISFIAIVKISFVIKVISSIKKDNFSIKLDRLVSLNKSVEFKEQHNIVTFKFQNYKKTFYDAKKNYINPCENDEFYLVFIKGESDPVKVYQRKYVTLDSSLKIS